jgi:hypothetical protein
MKREQNVELLQFKCNRTKVPEIAAHATVIASIQVTSLKRFKRLSEDLPNVIPTLLDM